MMKTYQSPIAQAIAAIAFLSTACSNSASDPSLAGSTEKLVTPPACRIDYSKIDWDGGGGFPARVIPPNVGGVRHGGRGPGPKYGRPPSRIPARHARVAQPGHDHPGSPAPRDPRLGPAGTA